MKDPLKVSYLTKHIGAFVLRDISFTLAPGRILGVVGVNGCGKTTLVRTILGSYRLSGEGDHGTLSLGALDSVRDQKAYRARLAYVMQDTPFDLRMKAPEAGALCGRYYPGFSTERYLGLLEEFGLDTAKPKCIGELSKGEQLRQQLAFALSYDALVYVLDEPTGNLDVEFRDWFYDKLRLLVAREDKAVICVSHLTDELETFADEILWLGKKEEQGFVRFLGTIEELREKYRILETTREQAQALPDGILIGGRERENHQEYLLDVSAGTLPDGRKRDVRYASLTEIMYYAERGRKDL